MALAYRSGMMTRMPDSLLTRAQFAIEESRKLQRRSYTLRTERDLERGELRRAVFESAMLRSEIDAHRDDQRSFFKAPDT
jgi:hypothetical protein